MDDGGTTLEFSISKPFMRSTRRPSLVVCSSCRINRRTKGPDLFQPAANTSTKPRSLL